MFKNVKECLSNSNVNLIDAQSHALLWDYLALLVRQNGIVDLKTDVSPLLLSGIVVDTQNQWTTSLSASSSTTNTQSQQDFVLVNSTENNSNNSEKLKLNSDQASLSEEETHLNKLRQLLGAGQRSDAIEFAIKYNMWPHALFLGSSIQSQNSTDSKILNKVKVRFINSLPPNDPILTCYQLLIGRVPTAASVIIYFI